MSDIDRPKHYAEGRTIEPWDAIIDWQVSYCIGSAIKYLSRAGRKGDAVTDLKKAIAFIEREIKRLTSEPK